MGYHEGWEQSSGLLPNGLLPNEVASVTRILDEERWSKAEERTEELIACIQPNHPSEERRNAVANYVQRLIMKCFSCQVFTFGSVPLKTYLPDGDIDLTAFSKNQNLKDTWAQDVRDILEKEEKSENAEFRVKEVQYIQAEVKIIKCLVENIVVDISFNQLGGLCTLCFLEEVDHLINQNHLFKRSIILIKAWCYYESRILGAHHGLISTYALETLVLYIFHVFNNSFTGPLEVLYRFLEFFSNFDWDNFCVSLWGPVPVSSLPDMTAEPPRRDSGELLLSKLFLDACSSVYAVFPGSQENQNQPFVSKHFNVIDPLRTNNNLGRSVSKGNFFRIRSAFAFGAKRLARLLECPKENLIAEVNQFFMNTWDRHGSGIRPDAPTLSVSPPRPLTVVPIDTHDNFTSPTAIKRSENIDHESQMEGRHPLHGVISSQLADNKNHPTESMSRTGNAPTVSRSQSHKIHSNQTRSRISDQNMKNVSSSETSQAGKGHKVHRPDYLPSEREGQGRYHFARTQSSPELTDASAEVLLQGRSNRVSGTGKNQFQSSSNRRKNMVGSEAPKSSHSARSSSDDRSSLRQSPSHQSLEGATNSNGPTISYQGDASMGPFAGEEPASTSGTMEMHQEEQDLVNMMASSRMHNFSGQVQVPLNLASGHLPLPLSHVVASMGYAQRNIGGLVPANIPLIEHSWRSNMQFPQELLSSPVSHYFPTVGLTTNPEEVVEFANESSGLTEVNQDNSDGFWHEHDAGSTDSFDPDNGNFQMLQLHEKQQPTGGFNFIPSRGSSSSSSLRGQQKFVKENREGTVGEEHSDSFQHPNNRANEGYSTDRSANMRLISGGQANSSRSKPASESSWDGSSVKSSKSTKDKRGRKLGSSSVPSTSYGKVKSGWQCEGSDQMSSQAEDDCRDWIPLSTMSSDVSESTGPASLSPHLPNNHQLPRYEPSQISGSDSVVPIGPMLVGSSRQRSMDNSGMLPIAFYPTGPPVPFLTMLPFYNFATEMGNSDASTSHFDRSDDIDSNSHVNRSEQNFDSTERLDQSEIFSSSNAVKSSLVEPPEQLHKSDILNSDFASHWQNLLYGRFCQNPRFHGPLIYPSPVVVPPVYLQGHFPLDGPGRPLSTNMNLFTQLMGYGPRLVPVAALQPSSNRPPSGGYQRFGDEVPRYRGGTGTYLPNPKVPYRDRQSSSTRNHRGNYNYDRNDHGEREANWNVSSKPRASGRIHARGQADRPSSRSDRLATTDTRTDRQWDSYRHEQPTYNSYLAQNSHFASANSIHGSASISYGMYPLPGVNSNGVSPTGPTVPPVLMLYSYDHNVGGYHTPAEQLEFGSLGPVQLSGVNEGPQPGDVGPTKTVYEQRHSTYHGDSPAHSSSSQPSSPHLQRSAALRKYQLKDEDFPPLSFLNDEGGGNSNYNGKSSHYRSLFTSTDS